MRDEVFFFANVSLAEFGTANATLKDIREVPQQYYNAGDITWMLVSSALVFLMVPGISLFYSGISDRKISLSMAWLPVMTAALVGVQWYLWGYAITFADSSSSTTLWGGIDGLAYHEVLLRPAPAGTDGPLMPEALFALFEGMFASFTAAILAGAAAWKDRPGHFLIFILFWTTFVYDQIARWSWNPDGWTRRLGGLDFAGGSPVHISTGASVLAHSLFHLQILPRLERLLSRKGDQPVNAGILASFAVSRTESTTPTMANNHWKSMSEKDAQIGVIHERAAIELPANHTNVLFGTMLLWVGWFGFNGGSAFGANVRAVSACVATHLAACAGGVTLCAARAIKQSFSRKGQFVFSVVDFCNGVIIGLVAITPAAGYVQHQVAPLFGLVAALVCWPASYVSERIDDSQYLFAVHGVGGIVGVLMTGVFAHGPVAALDGIASADAKLGWVDGNWKQIGIQAADGFSTLGYSFGVTLLILVVLEPLMFFFRRREGRSTQGSVEDRKVQDSATIMESMDDGR